MRQSVNADGAAAAASAGASTSTHWLSTVATKAAAGAAHSPGQETMGVQISDGPAATAAAPRVEVRGEMAGGACTPLVGNVGGAWAGCGLPRLGTAQGIASAGWAAGKSRRGNIAHPRTAADPGHIARTIFEGGHLRGALKGALKPL